MLFFKIIFYNYYFSGNINDFNDLLNSFKILLKQPIKFF